MKQVQGDIFKRGKTIKGRWEGNSYKIKKCLGRGGNGVVYLAEDQHGALRAIKVSRNLYVLNCEYRTLVFLRCSSELKNTGVMPEVFELDDFQSGKQVYHFLVMEYCPGKNLGFYKGRVKETDAARAGYKIALFLDHLHKLGLIFADLKPANIIYDFKTGSVRVVDYGSLTFKGSKVNQFTPGYDRATWNAGTRVADECYDMFSLGILLASLIMGKVTGRPGESVLSERISARITSTPLKKAVCRALAQDALDCAEIAGYLDEARKETVVRKKRGIGLKVNNFRILSAASFIVSAVYYYQLG